MSMFVNVLVKASYFFLVLFPFCWNYAGILLSSVYETYGGPLSIPRFNEACNFLRQTERKRFCYATFSPAISVLEVAAETIWCPVNMTIVKLLLHSMGATYVFFKKNPFTFEFRMLREQKVSRLLATSFKILVANTQVLVALATSGSQFRTLLYGGNLF